MTTRDDESQQAASPAVPSAGDPALPAASKPLPRLKVKPIGSRTGVPESASSAPADAPTTVGKPAVHRGTLFQGEALAADADSLRDAGTAVLSLPETGRTSSPFATYRPAPPDEAAEKAELEAVTGPKPERRVSTGFLLGLALIVVVLLGGVLMVRLNKKVNRMEQRLSQVEHAGQPAVTTTFPRP